MSSTKKIILIVVGVVIGLLLLMLLLQNSISDPEEANAAEKRLVYTETEREVVPQPWKPKPRQHGPASYEYELADPIPIPMGDGPILQKAGCANAKSGGKIETSVLGWDVMSAKMWQYFCWREGHIYRVDPIKKQSDVTAWGEGHGWSTDGWRDGPDGWTNYGDKYHGGHYAVKTAKFKACLVGAPFGCIESNSATIRLSVLEHAGGQWWGGVGK